MSGMRQAGDQAASRSGGVASVQGQVGHRVGFLESVLRRVHELVDSGRESEALELIDEALASDVVCVVCGDELQPCGLCGEVGPHRHARYIDSMGETVDDRIICMDCMSGRKRDRAST